MNAKKEVIAALDPADCQHPGAHGVASSDYCEGDTNQAILEALKLLIRSVDHLVDYGQQFEDDGSNEPLELAREIQSFLEGGEDE